MWTIHFYHLLWIKTSVLGALCLLACGSLLLMAVSDDYTRYTPQRHGIASSAPLRTAADHRSEIGNKRTPERGVSSFTAPGGNTAAGSDVERYSPPLPAFNRWGSPGMKWRPDLDSRQRRGESEPLRDGVKDTTLRSQGYFFTSKGPGRHKKTVHLLSEVTGQHRHEDVGASLTNIDVILDGVYWSDLVERRIPKGVSISEADQWVKRSTTMTVTSVQPSTAERCGREKNAFATLEDGTGMCARYRAPKNRLIQGEVLSYWLSRYLELDNVPPATISRVSSEQWRGHERTMHSALKWSPAEHVGLSMWIEDIDNSYHKRSSVVMSPLIIEALRSGHALDKRFLGIYLQDFGNKNTTQDQEKNLGALAEVAQWGTMVLFDYLTGNYDRVASMQDGADKEKRPEIMLEPIRNLRRSKFDGAKLWFIDNESGLLDAYDLMYGDTEVGHRFLRYHEDMLQSVCLFQKTVVGKLKELSKHKHPHQFLETFAASREPLMLAIEDSDSLDSFKTRFDQRLTRVVEWIRHCEANGAKEGGG